MANKATKGATPALTATKGATPALTATKGATPALTATDMANRIMDLQQPLFMARAGLRKAAELTCFPSQATHDMQEEAAWLRSGAEDLLKQLSDDLRLLASCKLTP